MTVTSKPFPSCVYALQKSWFITTTLPDLFLSHTFIKCTAQPSYHILFQEKKLRFAKKVARFIVCFLKKLLKGAWKVTKSSSFCKVGNTDSTYQFIRYFPHNQLWVLYCHLVMLLIFRFQTWAPNHVCPNHFEVWGTSGGGRDTTTALHTLCMPWYYTCAFGLFIEPYSYPLVCFPTNCTGQSVLTFNLIRNISEYNQYPFVTIICIVWDQTICRAIYSI